MRAIYERIAVFLIMLGVIGVAYNTYMKIDEGKSFERYRTVWLFEIDYFSVAFIFISTIVLSITLFIYFKVKDNKEIKDARKDLANKRNTKSK